MKFSDCVGFESKAEGLVHIRVILTKLEIQMADPHDSKFGVPEEIDGKAFRTKLRDDTFASKRGILVAFLLMLAFMVVALLFDYFETKLFRNAFLFLMFCSFGFAGVSIVATMGYVTYDKTGSTNPARLFDESSPPLRFGKTQFWRWFIMKEFVDV